MKTEGASTHQEMRDAARTSPLAKSQRKGDALCCFSIAPISTSMLLAYVAEHLLGLPRSF